MLHEVPGKYFIDAKGTGLLIVHGVCHELWIVYICKCCSFLSCDCYLVVFSLFWFLGVFWSYLDFTVASPVTTPSASNIYSEKRWPPFGSCVLRNGSTFKWADASSLLTTTRTLSGGFKSFPLNARAHETPARFAPKKASRGLTALHWGPILFIFSQIPRRWLAGLGGLRWRPATVSLPSSNDTLELIFSHSSLRECSG